MIEHIYENFKGFKLKYITSIKFVPKISINYYLKCLFSSNDICISLNILDLSDTFFDDSGMARLILNISKIKSIEIINLRNTKLTTKSKKYLKYFNNLKIKILIDQNKLLVKDNYPYKILLGGSTISGKTRYFCSCLQKEYDFQSTTSINCTTLYPSFNKNIEVELCDMIRWGSKFDSMISNFFINTDGILLLFDVNSRDDFNKLNDLLTLIRNYFELDDFPVLLIANKIDLPHTRMIFEEEIKQFQKDNKLIGYFEVSCKENINVQNSFDFLVNFIYKKEADEQSIKK